MKDEVRRVLYGPSEHEKDNGFDFMQVDVTCMGNAALVLDRAKEHFSTLVVLSDIADSNHSDEISTEDFLVKTSGWFREVGESYQVNMNELGTDYVGWFSDWRDWAWWDASVINDNHLAVIISVKGFPISGFDALRWLLLFCGATSVEQGTGQ